MTRHRTPPRSAHLPLGALTALLVCLGTVAWALLTLLSGGGPSSASDLGPEPPAAPAPSSSGAPAPSSGTAPRPQVGPADLSEHARVQEEARAQRPTRVLVPDVGIDSPVDPLGVRDDGQMEIPGDAARAGWYRFGPVPGAPGSAVLAGHVDDHLGRPGSLARLHDVEPGAEVVVEHADGSRTTYLVQSRRSVAKAELAVDQLFARGGEPVLVLVTCTGAWSTGEGRYEENLVVTARPRDR